MHVLPSAEFVIVSEHLDYVRTATGYRVSVEVKVKRTIPGKRVAPVVVAWAPMPLDDRWVMEETADVTFVTEESALLYEVGNLLTDEELKWYCDATGMRFTVIRGTERDEQTLRHTWTVSSPTIYVPLRQPRPSAPIPVTTVTISGGHKTLVTKPFGRVAIKGSSAATSTVFPLKTRPLHDLVEYETVTTQDEKNCTIS